MTFGGYLNWSGGDGYEAARADAKGWSDGTVEERCRIADLLGVKAGMLEADDTDGPQASLPILLAVKLGVEARIAYLANKNEITGAEKE